ncbi:MAG: response regulator transcription factor [Desulfobacteraceae bacterium]|nr:response regulator transcription factor [Desulfobacteraceae bacterium]
MIRIMIADDHSIVRKGLRQIVADARDMVVCEEARDGRETLQKAMTAKYDVLVLDISMPGGNVLDLLKKLKTFKPLIKILVLSMHSEEQYAARLLKAGASGYLNKESAPEELIRAIRKVSQGKKHISLSFAERMADQMAADDPDKPLHETLSSREYQVFLKLAGGLQVTEIADELFLNSRTISTYRTRILQKLHLKNNAELIHYAIKHDLIEHHMV